MKNSKIFLVLSLLLASLAFAGNASAFTLSLTPSSVTGSVGSPVSFDVSLSYASGEEVISANFDVVYDDSILNYTGYDVPASPFDSVSITDPNPGLVPPITFAVSAGVPLTADGTAQLATIHFLIKPTTAVSTELSFATVDIYSDNPDISPTGEAPSATITITQNTTPVPEPSSVLLIGAGIACLFVARRRNAG